MVEDAGLDWSSMFGVGCGVDWPGRIRLGVVEDVEAEDVGVDVVRCK